MMPFTYAQDPKDFGFKLMPEKLVKGTEGLLQVFGLQKNIPISYHIKDLIVTSSNQDVLKILESTIDEDTSITSVKVRALESGTAKIAIAAPGYISEEFSVTVYDIKQGGQKLLVKTVPETFTINGPSRGYFSVELADSDSNPTLAKEDIVVSVTASNSKIMSIIQDQVKIKEGEYFATGAFEVKNPGEVSIYAESLDTDSGSSKVNVQRINGDDVETNKNYKIQLYVLPQKISNFASSSTFAIVQLQALDGTPIRATADIPVSLKIDHADPIFNDKRNSEISTADSLIIPEGSTTGFAKLSVKAGVQETYQVIISAEDYLVSEPQEFSTVLTPDVDDPLTKLDTLPLLASGAEQLIGVLYPSDENGVALINLKTVESEINSSDRNALAISDDRMEKGSGAKLIYGQLGVTKPSSLEISILAEKQETILPTVFGPEKSDLELAAEPLISKVMPKSNFPIAVYLKNSEASWYFPEATNVVMIPNEYVKSSVQTINQGESVALLNSYSSKEGTGTLEFDANDFSTSFSLVTGISKPGKIHLTYPDHLISDMKNTISLQILDSDGNPIFANKDFEFRMASNDDTIKIPEVVTIKKGAYNAFFDIVPKQKIETEISVLASDFPLSKFKLNTVETNPSLIISTVNTIESGKTFDLVLDAQILGIPIENVKINWEIQGAEIQQISDFTDSNGKIKATLVAGDSGKINIKAVTGDSNQIMVAKEIQIIKPDEIPLPLSGNSLETSQVKNSNPLENNIGLILIPGVVVGSTILIRKRSLLEPLAARFPIVERVLDKFDEIFERIGISEKLETIKEKIPVIRNR